MVGYPFYTLVVSLYLCNHLKHHQIIQLPPIETLSAFAGAVYCELDDGSFQNHRLHTQKAVIVVTLSTKNYLKTFKTIDADFVDKIILTSSAVEKDCIVILFAHSALTRLAICKIGDAKWTNLDEAGGCCSDVVYSSREKKLYTSPESEASELPEIWDLSNASSPRKAILKYSLFCHPKLYKMHKWSLREETMSKTYLVANSSGKLLMVKRNIAFDVSEDGKRILSCEDETSCRYPPKTLRFDVFEFDEEENKFKYVRDLGGKALFLGINHSIAVNAREVSGIEPNAIYFGDYDLFDDQVPYAMFGGHDFGIYNVGDDGLISPCYPIHSKEFLHQLVWLVS